MPRIMVFALVLVVSCAAVSQEQPRISLALDYSYLRLSVPNSVKPVDMNGIQLSGSFHHNDWLAGVVDFGAYYHCVAGCWSDTSLARNYSYTLMAGPRITVPTRSTFRPFFGASAGLLNVRYSEDLPVLPSPTGVGVINGGAKVTDNHLAIAAGGGLEYGRGRARFRLAQVDWFSYSDGQRRRSSMRFSAGVRFGFGNVQPAKK